MTSKQRPDLIPTIVPIKDSTTGKGIRYKRPESDSTQRDKTAANLGQLATGFEMIRSDELDAVLETFAEERVAAEQAVRSEGVVPVRMISYLGNKVEEINVAARKLDLPEYTLEIGSSLKEQGRSHGSRYVNVTIEGEPPKTPSDHLFLGVLKHDPDGAPNQVYGDVAPLTIEQFRDSPGTRCDSCGVKHDRRTSVIVGNVETGEVLQVGGSCMKSHLGMHKSPEQILEFAELQAEFTSDINRLLSDAHGELAEMDQSSGWMNSTHRDARIRRPLNVVIAALVKEGRTNGSAFETDRSRNEITVRHTIFNQWSPTSERAVEDLSLEEDDYAEADDVISWVQNLSDDELEQSSHLRNVKAAFDDPEGNVSNFNLHLVASAVNRKQRHGKDARLAEAEQRKTDLREQKRLNGPDPEGKSRHVGQLDERSTHTATVIGRTTKKFTDWRGTTVKHSVLMRDADGNLLRAWASKSFDPDDDTEVTFKGTVKNHSYGRGNAQITDLSRPSIPKN